MHEFHEECGVGAYFLKDQAESSFEVPSNLINIASSLQHRGQRSAGGAFFNPHGEKIIVTHKEVGAVLKVFALDNSDLNRKIMERCKSVAGIVHTRYCTSGGGGENDDSAFDEVQPFERRHGRTWKRFALAFNGNIANYKELRDEMVKEHGYHLDTKVDTEVLMHLIALEIQSQSKSFISSASRPDMFEVIKNVMKKLDGAYNVVLLFADGSLIVFRDPHGFRPLVWGENENAFAFASESRALERIGIKKFQDVLPGEVLLVNKNGVSRRIVANARRSFCHFEGIYFEKANSRNDGLYIKKVREDAGRELAKSEPLKDQLNGDYVVVPAPWTAVPAAEAYAEALGLQFRLAIEKDESLRGFINGTNDRAKIMKRVYVTHSGDVAGKKVLVVDDSLVRGETSKLLIQRIREAGAKEVHLRLTEPPIKFPCFYGIDIPSRKELIANKYSGEKFEENIAREIGADSVIFQTIDGLVNAFGIPKENLCLACLTGEYPTEFGRKRFSEVMKEK